VELTSTPVDQHDLDHVASALQAACGRIAPLWPLESFVAVNPYLGLLDHGFEEAALTLSHAAGTHTTMPAAFYRSAHDRGLVEDLDIEAALRARGRGATTAAELLTLAEATSELAPPRILMPSEVASTATGRDWARLRTDRVSGWAAAHFDRGQALWRSADAGLGAFASWKQDASLDRTPDIMGLKGFRSTVRSLPDDPVTAAALALDELGVGGEAVLPFVHALLLRVGGWAAFTARVAWDAGLAGEQDDTPVQFAAVLLCWELGIWRATTDPAISAAWSRARARLDGSEEATVGDEPLALHLLLQDAYDRSAQRRLVGLLSDQPVTSPDAAPTRPSLQAMFCIDVRSELFRRNLEATGSGIETLGFAGFFGLPLGYLPLAHEAPIAQCPVLLSPAHVVAETLPDEEATADAVARRRLDHHVTRAWKSFKMGAVSCFSFVGPVGLAYLPKLITDGRGLTRPVQPPETDGLPAAAVAAAGPSLVPGQAAATGLTTGIEPTARIDLAEGALRGMSLVEGFAPIVLLAGHGSSTVNNPYGTGLDCGACGGHTGEVSARVAASMLNDPAVRHGLAERGIEIPDDTWFVAALHDTTTDDVTLYDTSSVPAGHREQLAEIAALLADAGHRCRAERANRMGLGDAADPDAAVRARATDWAQVRPEWGLAGCRAFIAAPRAATRGLDLGGRAFLHSYDRHSDDGFGVLETIMTAPMIVASWISLQYYASTVDNEHFGSGDKTLHNVVGRVGVLEGNGGDLRSGLPWQSVHDGTDLQHEPLRLQVVIAAPTDAMSSVIARHDMVRELCDNRWLALYACDDDGTVTHRYAGGLTWEEVGA
jgi:uncharacterized protein YbcC (UPF0753/DUF2309 family)